MYGRGSTKICNFVHVDEIWKDHVKLELTAQRKWPEKWGFLSKTYQQLEDDLLTIGEDTTEQNLKEASKPKDKDVSIPTPQEDKKPPVPFPKTDSQMIGWRLHYQTPKSMKYMSSCGKKDIIKQLGWPREGC
ncbi:uncharacterized protein C20orf85 homolog [Actinia tenebrosa]|uniref:Uncharacterized protein C20orf85 homolog n=1 Tax=Actinia tenebrosa TaxID=6105 RepID=A0A6P8HYT6_ACTTE|nr:uncharacterized protein C20orf85 homolog [Actinia tenebrosa]